MSEREFETFIAEDGNPAIRRISDATRLDAALARIASLREPLERAWVAALDAAAHSPKPSEQERRLEHVLDALEAARSALEASAVPTEQGFVAAMTGEWFPASAVPTSHYAEADPPFIRANPDWQGEPIIAAGHTHPKETCPACLPASAVPTDHKHEFRDETRMLVGQNFTVRACACGQVGPASAVPEPTDLDVALFATREPRGLNGPVAEDWSLWERGFWDGTNELAARLRATPPGPHSDREDEIDG